MKRIKSIIVCLLAFAAVTAFAGCGEKAEDKTSADTTAQAAAEKTTEEVATVEETTAPAEIKAGDKGTGPVTLNALYADLKIPDGIDYEVSTYGLTVETSGSMNVRIGKGNEIEISTTRMISSLDDAMNELKRTSGNDCEVTELDDVTVGDITYKSAHIKGAYKDIYCYVYYYKNFQDRDTYVEIMYDNSEFDFARGIELTDPVMVDFIGSINYK